MTRPWRVVGAAMIGAAVTGTALEVTAQGQPPPLQAGNPTTAPYKSSGYYQFVKPDGLYHCTAQFIGPRVLLTAAHCVRSREGGVIYDLDHKNTGFLLQYQNGQASDVYKGKCVATWPEWVVNFKPGESESKPETWSAETSKAFDESWQWDYAMILTDHDSATGFLKVDYKGHYGEAWAIGYPGAMMQGDIIQRVNGEMFDTKYLEVTGSPNVMALWHGSLDFTGGASGGAWVVNMSADETKPNSNLVVGLVSFGQPSLKPGGSFGPRFNQDFDALYKFVEAGCPKPK